MTIKKTDNLKNAKEVLAQLSLPPAAADWLFRLYRTIQVFDDLQDGEVVSNDDLNEVIWDSFVSLHSNEFYAKYRTELLPLMVNAILKWRASNTLEKESLANEKSFMWRAAYFDIVLQVFCLCHGPEVASKNAHIILGLYGESLEDYLKEYPPCQVS